MSTFFDDLFPNIIIFDLNGTQNKFNLSLLHGSSDYCLIDLNTLHDEVLVLTDQCNRVVTDSELAKIVISHFDLSPGRDEVDE